MTGNAAMSTDSLLVLLALFAIGEMIAVPVFYLIRGQVERAEKFDDVRLLNLETLKGFLERATLSIGLWAGYPQVLTAFAAVKLANRLSTEGGDDHARHYFVIGNLLSTLIALGYVVATRLIMEPS